MAAEPDDDALTWAGDDDPTLAARTGDEPADRLAPGWTAVGSTGRVADAEPVAPEERAETSAVTLVTLGVMGGIYLLYTLGWAVSAGRIGTGASDPVAQVMFAAGSWFAVVAAPLWFAATLWLAHGRARVAWLVAGAVLLVPLPFILGTGVAS
ncbi:MAG: hypothetical protein ABWY36_00570 [Leifsonia sp.]